ncbi:MAG: alpha/beta fold hydrolase [Planctomycetes bacterium]|nr:alpha/beta fold hydrolase [Planctomycetota bacterium]
MPAVNHNGVSLFYAERGEGVPLIFLNGLAGDHQYWMGQLRALSNRFRCLALDNRDTGQSSYATASYTITDLADDVAGFMAQLSLPAAHIVGLSLGGMIAQEMALRHPARVRSLFLVGTVAKADDWFCATLDAYGCIRRQVRDTSEFFQVLLPWLVSHRYFEQPERVEWLKALLAQNPHPQKIEGFFRQFEAIRGHDTLDRLASITCPVLLAAGADDSIAPPRYSRQLAERLPHARLEIMPDVGHAPPIEDPRGFNRLLDGFLSS